MLTQIRFAICRGFIILTLIACVALVGNASRAAASQNTAASEIDSLAEEFWHWRLKGSVSARQQMGLPVIHLKDITLEEIRRDAELARTFLDKLLDIDSTALDHDREITRRYLIRVLEGIEAGPKDFVYQFPITPYGGGFGFTAIVSYLGQASFLTKEERANYITLLNEIVDLLKQTRDKVAYQAKHNVYLPKPAIPGAINLMSGLKTNVTNATIPSAERLSHLSSDERDAFDTEIRAVVEQRIRPAFDAIVSFLGDDYVAQAPDGVGVGQYADGIAHYSRLIKKYTSFDYTPEELHQVGLRQIEELSDEMAAIRNEVGFEGTRVEFHDLLRSDPRFLAESPEEVEARYKSFIARIEPFIDDYFLLKPQAPYGVKRLAPENEAGQTFGYYQVPTKSEPTGYYRYNGSNLESRSLVGAGPLIYHELIPGHHFHIALQLENEALPQFRRKQLSSEVSGFNEGWAEYAAGLAEEMGLYQDPYDRYGRLVMTGFLSVRLVVDTGMNALGWTLEDARIYMKDHTMLSDLEIGSETLRYSTDIPGQALAYKIGHMKFLEYRANAEAALGKDFDIKDFHAEVLRPGALPMDIVGWHIEHFIEGVQN